MEVANFLLEYLESPDLSPVSSSCLFSSALDMTTGTVRPGINLTYLS